MSSDPKEEAARDFLRISASPRSTEYHVAMLHLIADAYASRTAELAADRLAHTAAKPGAKAIDDAAVLARIEELRPRLGPMTVAFMARQQYTGDEAAQDAASRRWRRKLKSSNSNTDTL